MESLTIRPAGVDDAPAVCDLIVAFAKYVDMPPPDDAARTRLVEHGFGSRPLYQVALAELAGNPNPVGYALFFNTYSSFGGRPTLYVEDLFVVDEYRRRGIGRALFRHCIRAACEQGCGRMEWECLHRDKRAQAFYDGLGAARIDEAFRYQLSAADIERLDRE